MITDDFEDFAAHLMKEVPPSRSADPSYLADIDDSYQRWDREQLQPHIERLKASEETMEISDLEAARRFLLSIVITLGLACVVILFWVLVKVIWGLL